MSHKDYTKYAKGTELIVDDIVDVAEPEVEVAAEPVPEVTPEPVVEPEVVVEVTPEPEPEVVETLKIGRVFGCSRLNVRKAPKFDADVVCEIPVNTEVEIDEDESKGDFYKIYTASGIEGFCMKSYIFEK